MGKELVREVLHGSDIASYNLLLWCTGKVAETNLGSIIKIDRDGERFRRGFFYFHASLDGFRKDYRLLLFLDGTHLLSRYGGDALYGEENYDKIITFILDRSKGLINAIARVFPSSPHGYCLRHLQANFLKANSRLGRALKDECWSLLVKIAYACTASKFDDYGSRWGEMYSNVAESFNAWIREARHLPVCNIVDSIRFKLMNMMYRRREQCQNWDTHLCPVLHKRIEETVEESGTLVVGLFQRGTI
ncbi:uncharacterized protein LOC120271679 [Dioscorea cayenensis subsp. rotundata]|uniref:Uncharacterized protein LOC120271679 n=1 Tax=Dioscorea cayennensis subsp. rotundata TaxID=55577 RepID=A0AB40C3E3_DIOCR|nr:uncharacterized protein LOC120271679 [Dioscorea cayenensis subsp. rotundata]